MNNFNIISFIISLKERDRFIIVLLIAVGTLWGQEMMDRNAYTKLENSYRVSMIAKADACSNEKMRIMTEYINIIRTTNRQVDSIGKINMSIIDQNNKNIHLPIKSK